MKVKRLVATLTAGFDQFVNKVENHEAVADSLIADVRAAAARLKIQLARVRDQHQRLAASRDAARTACERWRERALRLEPADAEAAMKCMRRLEQEEAREQALTNQLAEQQQLAGQLEASLGQVEARLDTLRLRKSALASRSARADALATTSDLELTLAVDDVFERWEQSVLEQEYLEPAVPHTRTDAFEQALEDQETDARLLERLAALRHGRDGGAS